MARSLRPAESDSLDKKRDEELLKKSRFKDMRRGGQRGGGVKEGGKRKGEGGSDSGENGSGSGSGGLGADEDVGDAVEAMDRCRRKKEEIVGDVPHPRVCARDYRLEAE